MGETSEISYMGYLSYMGYMGCLSYMSCMGYIVARVNGAEPSCNSCNEATM